MPVAEYKLHKQGHRRLVPEFIDDRGHWHNPANHTYIGWIEENPDHYVPDTIVYLTKEQFISRALSIHEMQPMRKSSDEYIGDGEIMTTEEVVTAAGIWFDLFIEKNSTNSAN
jgi:hypothetical protein